MNYYYNYFNQNNPGSSSSSSSSLSLSSKLPFSYFNLIKKRRKIIEENNLLLLNNNELINKTIILRINNNKRIKKRNYYLNYFYSKILIFGTFLAFFASILIADGNNNIKSNEINVDWTLETITGLNITKQQQNNNNNNKYSSIFHSKILTKYVYLKDVLHFNCPLNKQLAIYLVPAESAILCHLPALEPQNSLAPIGFCGPNSGSDPRLIIRRYSPLPGKPSFREGNSYFFISTSNGSPNGTAQTSGGLCRTEGLRLRIIVLPSSPNVGNLNRPADEWIDLAHILMPIIIPSSITTTISTPKASALSSNINSVFPAILSLEQGGQRHKVLVKSQSELTEQLNANEQKKIKNDEEREDIDINEDEEQQKQKFSEEEKQQNNQKKDSSLYELMDERINSINRLNRNGKSEDSKEILEEKHLRRRRPVPKTARSPDPLVESQKLVYIIGYDGHGNNGGINISSSSISNKIVINRWYIFLLLSIIILLFYLNIYFF